MGKKFNTLSSCSSQLQPACDRGLMALCVFGLVSGDATLAGAALGELMNKKRTIRQGFELPGFYCIYFLISVQSPYCKSRPSIFCSNLRPRREERGPKIQVKNNRFRNFQYGPQKNYVSKTFINYLWVQVEGKVFNLKKPLNSEGRTMKYGALNWPIAAHVLTEIYTKQKKLKFNRDCLPDEMQKQGLSNLPSCRVLSCVFCF